MASLTTPKKVGLSIAALAASGAMLIGGNLAANAETSPSSTSSSSSSSSTENSGQSAGGGTTDQRNTDQNGPSMKDDGQRGRGGEGECAGRGPGGHGGPGGPGGQHTEVAGAEAEKVSAAVTAQDSSVTIEGVRKDADGSYDVLGTKDGEKVFYEVSADLSSVSLKERPSGHRERHEMHDQMPSGSPTDANGSSTTQG